MDYYFEVLQIIVACLCGLSIGFEREYHGAQAGIRTYSLVCIGSCLFGIISTHANGAAYYESIADPTRIAAQIVSGVGFLGAGIIFKGQSRISGVTTAANVWVTASIGLAIAFKMFFLPIFTTVLIIFILSLNRMSFYIRLNKHIKEKNFHQAIDDESHH